MHVQPTTRCSSRAAVVVGGWRAPKTSLAARVAAFPGQYGRAFYSSGAAHSKSPHIKSMKFIASSACSMQWAIKAASAAVAHALSVLFGVSMLSIVPMGKPNVIQFLFFKFLPSSQFFGGLR